MTEYRAKLMVKITKKIAGLIDELDLLISAELQNVNEYGACEEVCQHMSDAEQNLRKAVYNMQQAAAAAELEDMQDNMQQSLEQLSGGGRR